MNALARMLLVSLLIAGIAGSTSAQESRTDKTVAVAKAPVFAGRTLTGKERLGPKWTDEQRIDDCNVPVEKRGRPRPTACSQSAVGF